MVRLDHLYSLRGEFESKVTTEALVERERTFNDLSVSSSHSHGVHEAKGDVLNILTLSYSSFEVLLRSLCMNHTAPMRSNITVLRQYTTIATVLLR
jgi:hypothetical protein